MAISVVASVVAAAAVTVGAAVSSVALVAPESAVALMFGLPVAVVVLADFAVLPGLLVDWGRRVSFFDDEPEPFDDDGVLADDDFEPPDDEPESASAWATPVPLASAAPMPSVIAAAPSHTDG
ncbi:hypothetical protein ACTXG7_22005 [Mycolicibacterium sp. Dal123E01]|uniref:hypothetical protein n=1 Tax=Mycolicibacterium sp. Dal123E01 TaxID=3457578 RepID=UPI00403E59B7